jgi:hypothetical protein
MKDHESSEVGGTRRTITLTLLIGGAIAGVLVGTLVTPLGKIVAGAPSADLANYLRNAVAFGTIGAFAAPVVTWSTLRRVPLWRAVVEPLLGAAAGAGVGALLGSGVAFLGLIPVGAAAAAGRLAMSHREPPSPRAGIPGGTGSMLDSDPRAVSASQARETLSGFEVQDYP